MKEKRLQKCNRKIINNLLEFLNKLKAKKIKLTLILMKNSSKSQRIDNYLTWQKVKLKKLNY